MVLPTRSLPSPLTSPAPPLLQHSPSGPLSQNLSSKRPPSRRLLSWYRTHGRSLPWRAKNFRHTNVYHVWLSEMMLQQTTVVTAIPYFQKFVNKWPTLQDLSQAHLDDILHAWQGLGYYRRAGYLHKCAQVVEEKYQGHFPQNLPDLMDLPGIGPYTAAALMTIGYNRPVVAVDGNIARVLSRFYKIPGTNSVLYKNAYEKGHFLLPRHHVAHYTQALMDLGALICKPQQPLCAQCPWKGHCAAYFHQETHLFPQKTPKKTLPKRYATFYWMERPDGFVLLEKNPQKGLLGGLMALPSTPWDSSGPSCVAPNNPLNTHGLQWEKCGELIHTFTHFRLYVAVYKNNPLHPSAHTLRHRPGLWVPPHAFDGYAFSQLMKKAIACANPSIH